MNADDYTNQELFLNVGDGHQIYIQDWGNPKAETPIITFHGGPGSSSKDGHKQNFDPKQHRVIFFHQRGCGKSLPYGSLQNNTTDDTVADAHKIIEHFGFKQIILQGSSWGSCLALSYALKHPANIKALVVSGIFTGNQSEQDWILNGGFRPFFPHVWDEYLAKTPKNHQNNPSGYHLKSILGDDESAAHNSAMALSSLEGAIMSLDDRFKAPDPLTFDMAGTKIFAHYCVNNFFLPNNYILDNAHKLTMPVWIVQGRYDMDCPPITAYNLDKTLSNSKIIWTVANHRGGERETYTAVRTILLQYE
jgi:proline iminopeptidase